ncbi:trypsin-like peptidase domain-containing protein [Amycolatopsis sp. lyj-23]|uniref:trypsin-like serine peptidase n=1 Tax=Amycolatopsis sp. lyj-23 TaxID=2789283 RepID=UPI00397E5F41
MTLVRLVAVLVLGAAVAFTATASVAGVGRDGAAAPAPSAPPVPETVRPSPAASAPALDRPATAVVTSSPATTPSQPSPSTTMLGSSAVPTGPARPGSARAQVADPATRLAVGALFSGGEHYCSASVVDSPHGNLVLTAAHCVHEGAGGGAYSDVTFEPGYHDGIAPFGAWTVSQVFVAPGWESASDPDLDFAFLTVRQDGNPATLQSLTGANRLGIDRGDPDPVTLTGYPDSTDLPVTCQDTATRYSANQLQISCPGFPQGTSGSPWVLDADPATDLGTVIGVIGGFESGGDDDVSYSSSFDSDVETLYRAAITG